METIPKVSIVIPAYNEEEVLAPQLDFIVENVSRIISNYEILVVENGSKDQTQSLLLKYSETSEKVKPIIFNTPDYGKAMREGILCSSGDIIHICQIDFFDPDFFEQSLKRLSEGTIFVIGSRNRRGWDRRPIQRQILTFGLNLTLRLFFNFKGTDTHGLKTFFKSNIIDFVHQCKMGRGVFDTEMVLRAQYAGIEIVEDPVEAYEIRGKRNTYFQKIFRNLKDLSILKYHLRKDS